MFEIIYEIKKSEFGRKKSAIHYIKKTFNTFNTYKKDENAFAHG